MKEKYLNHAPQHKASFKEMHLIFQELSETLEKAAENFLNIASKLLETVTKIADKAVSAIDYTGAYAVKAGRKVEDWVVGEPEDLSEYYDMVKYFDNFYETIKNLDSDPDKAKELHETLKNCLNLDIILLSHIRIAFLNLRIAQVKNFIGPALSQFQLVERELNKIYNLRGVSTMAKVKGEPDERRKFNELVAEIKRLSDSIEESEFPADHPDQIDRSTLLKKKQSELEILKAKLAVADAADLDKDSVVVEWPSVFIVPTRFPPRPFSLPIPGWFTKYVPSEFVSVVDRVVDRVVFNNSYKQPTDINELYEYFQSYLNLYKKDLEKYSKEIDKLKHCRDTSIATSTAGLTSEDPDEHEKAEKLKEALDKALANINAQFHTNMKFAGNYPSAGKSKHIESIRPSSTERWKPTHNVPDDAF